MDSIIPLCGTESLTRQDLAEKESVNPALPMLRFMTARACAPRCAVSSQMHRIPSARVWSDSIGILTTKKPGQCPGFLVIYPIAVYYVGAKVVVAPEII